MNALAVLCPTCLAKPGNPCRSIVPLVSGRAKVAHGQPCRPHAARRAKASGFKVIPKEDA